MSTKKKSGGKKTSKVKKAAGKPAGKATAKKAVKKAPVKPVSKKAAKKVAATKVVSKKVTAKAPAKGVTSRKTRSLFGAKDTSGIVIKGVLAIDTDGTGPSHNDGAQQKKTSAKATASGQFVPLDDPRGVRFLNADVDEYSVAPKNFAKVNGGPLSAGDLAKVVLPNGVTRTVPIGDFGPNNKAGEFSLAAVQAMGVDVIFTKHGPIPTLDGPAASDIHVTVTFQPGTGS